MTIAAFVIALVALGLSIYNVLGRPKVKIVPQEKAKK